MTSFSQHSTFTNTLIYISSSMTCQVLFLLIITYHTVIILGLAQPRISIHLFAAPTARHVDALSKCGMIIARNWKSPVQTRIRVFFKPGMNRSLGLSFPTDHFEVNGARYPIAMAKLLTGRDLNTNSTGIKRYDMVVNFNANKEYYVGTDGQPPSNQYDLVSVCVHEIVHGLFMTTKNIIVVRGEDGSHFGDMLNKTVPNRFDQFLACETDRGDCALASYNLDGTANDFTPLVELESKMPRYFGRCVTGNSLWFRSSTGRIARIFAPNEFEKGSSITHLDESSYNHENSLLTPFMERGFARHAWDPLLLEILQVMMNQSEPGAAVCNQRPRPLPHSNTVVVSPVPPTPTPSPSASMLMDADVFIEFLP